MSSRIKRTDYDGPSPLHIVTREEIDRAGAMGLTDLLRDISEATPNLSEGNTTGAARGVTAFELHNLGPANTLMLVDGRRQAFNGISNNSGTVFVDPNRFPAAMIERVEVLKDGASAIYGPDASAGVVNIITRKNFTGAELTARYGNYLKTDGAEQTYSFVGGSTRGPLNVTAVPLMTA